jgi:hypothetical protein
MAWLNKHSVGTAVPAITKRCLANISTLGYFPIKFICLSSYSKFEFDFTAAGFGFHFEAILLVCD